jgi:hypothetical protein
LMQMQNTSFLDLHPLMQMQNTSFLDLHPLMQVQNTVVSDLHQLIRIKILKIYFKPFKNYFSWKQFQLLLMQ